jgi:UDP-N-acetylglucosamine 4,6-dehydratase/5-epimerase
MSSSNFYHDKTILVTGGAGSIGSEVVRSLIPLKPRAIRVLDNNETGLFNLEQQMDSDCLRAFVGDIRDKERLARAMENVDIVFHGAALKHVPLCEFNPFDAIKTNVIGTQNLLDVALDEEIEKLIFISTDKVVNPTNVMGTTKLLGERLTISANYYKGKRKTVFSCVRFGNVLGSRGSVIPLFINQIREGKPITITDPDMTRFIMSIPRSVELILKAGEIGRGGELFILKMPALKISDLAEIIIEEYAPKFGKTASEIEIKIIGKRNGEKLFEELVQHDETHVYENNEMLIVLPEYQYRNSVRKYTIPPSFKRVENRTYSSNDMELMSKKEILSEIRKFSFSTSINSQ